MTEKQIIESVKRQLSYELNCEPEDFSREENIITSANLHEKKVFGEAFLFSDCYFRE